MIEKDSKLNEATLTKSKSLGIFLVTFGVLLILGAPILIWLFREKFAAIGPHVFTAQWHGGGGLILLYMVSGLPIGAILTALGGAYLLSSSMKAQRVLLPLLGVQLVYFGYHGIATFRYLSVPVLLFGFTGCLFIALFLLTVWVWMRKRPTLEPKDQRILDLQLGGVLCFFTAAWQACGLASAPGFAFYPELVQKLSNQSFLVSQLLAIHIFMILGFVYLLLAIRGERTSHTAPNINSLEQI